MADGGGVAVGRVEAVGAVDGVNKKESERAKNMFALGLMSWLYHRPTEGTIAFLRTKFAKRPEIAEANVRAFKAGHAYGETTESFSVSYEVAPAPMSSGTYRNISGNLATAYGLIAASQLSGLPLFLGAVLRVRDIHQTAVGLGRKLGIRIKAVEMSDPIAAIDVDKAADYTLVNQILDGRA